MGCDVTTSLLLFSGTGAVVAAGFINAMKLAGVPSQEQRIVFYGAGSAGIGVANQIVEVCTKKLATTGSGSNKLAI